ncbi:MAG: amylo-alpha-1,6-glucosidase [Armatimonadota bacterium]|nr:hypothetical protein [bacterium]
MNIIGTAMDWAEALTETVFDPESRPAGFAEPHYHVSEKVTVSRDHGIYVYHLPDDQLGQGSSLGNGNAWAETKGNGDMLSFFSIEAGARVMGGMSVTYNIPFTDLSTYGAPAPQPNHTKPAKFTRTMPSAVGSIHLHPAYQQREFVIGDGVQILETFYLPRTGLDDPAAACEVVLVRNRTPHPIGLTLVASLDPRGHSPLDMVAEADESRSAIIAWNQSQPNWVRVFGGVGYTDGYWATTDHEEAYSPRCPLPNRVDGSGDLIASVQFDLLVLPYQQRKVRVVAAFSPNGKAEAVRAYDRIIAHGSALKDTVEHYNSLLQTAVVDMPDHLLSTGVQWAKACVLRPVSRYKIGTAVTNDPGRSTHLVGRDTAWYAHGCDFIKPELSCDLLEVFAKNQRGDGLIAEYIDGNTGKSEDYGFNINDNTPLYLLAVDHHIKLTGHHGCLEYLYDSARRAAELILRERNEQGLVRCKADGMGGRGVCGWRNVLEHDRISGVVTEVNAECYAALRGMADLAEIRGYREEARRYLQEASDLREQINKHLLNPDNGLYLLNIDLDGDRNTQVTCDQVFPLMFGVADPETAEIITARLSEHDFRTAGGIRVVPSEDPRYDPSFEAGCMGGVWPGVTWWYAMSASKTNPRTVSDSLRRAYEHYVSDPKVYNTVPGQFSEWSDGQTLVNRGMRLSPWDSPRFLWAAVEGLAGIKLRANGVELDPRFPSDWRWLRVHKVAYRDGWLSFFLTRQVDGLHVYTINSLGCEHTCHVYTDELDEGAEAITTGISTSAFRREEETLICLGNSLTEPILGPFLTHHSLCSYSHYKVMTLSSHHDSWVDMGVMTGLNLQRLVVRVEPKGYALYRFIRQ